MSVAGSEHLSDEQLRALYAWIDAIPLSRPKRNIQRDFSDGVLLAEVVAVYFPALVEVHNYGTANSLKQKIYNFETLNTRVLKKLGYSIPRSSIEDIVNCRPGAIESVLNNLQLKMAKYREKKALGDALSPGNEESSVSHVTPRGAAAGFAQPTSGNKAKAGGARGNNGHKSVMASVDEEILMEKETQIRELQETVEILELKVAKLEQLVRLKDNKIAKLMSK
jgi:hypothetical protein